MSEAPLDHPCCVPNYPTTGRPKLVHRMYSVTEWGGWQDDCERCGMNFKVESPLSYENKRLIAHRRKLSIIWGAQKVASEAVASFLRPILDDIIKEEGEPQP